MKPVIILLFILGIVGLGFLIFKPLSFEGGGWLLEVGEYNTVVYDGLTLKIPVDVAVPKDWTYVGIHATQDNPRYWVGLNQLTEEQCNYIGFNYDKLPLNNPYKCTYDANALIEYNYTSTVECIIPELTGVQKGGVFNPAVRFNGQWIYWDSGGRTMSCKGFLIVHLKEDNFNTLPVPEKNNTIPPEENNTNTGGGNNESRDNNGGNKEIEIVPVIVKEKTQGLITEIIKVIKQWFKELFG